MSELSLNVWAILAALAMLMGFVADRTNLCTVSAVSEIMTQRRASVLWHIARIVLWIMGITTLIQYFLALSPSNHDRFVLTWVGLGGGLLFGIGAALNGGCSLQTITRMARGNLGTVFSLLGMPVGAAVVRMALLHLPEITPARAAPLAMSDKLQLALVLLFGLWLLRETAVVLRNFQLSQAPSRLLAPQYQPGSSAALMGIANGILFSLVGTWMFTYTLVQSLTNLSYPDSILYRPVPVELWWLLGAYTLGITLSSIQSRHALLQAKPEPLWIRYFIGGVFMGLGAALVPGGNDVLLFNGIPGLSLHALPAYGAMLVGIGIALAAVRKFVPGEPELC